MTRDRTTHNKINTCHSEPAKPARNLLFPATTKKPTRSPSTRHSVLGTSN